jgi:hypothetical protein
MCFTIRWLSRLSSKVVLQSYISTVSAERKVGNNVPFIFTTERFPVEAYSEHLSRWIGLSIGHPDLQTSDPRFLFVGGTHGKSSVQAKVETQNTFFRHIVAANDRKDNPSELMWGTLSINGWGRVCIEAKTGYFEQYFINVPVIMNP